MRFSKHQVDLIVRKHQIHGVRSATLLGFLMGICCGGGVVALAVGSHAVNIDFSKLSPTVAVESTPSN